MHGCARFALPSLLVQTEAYSEGDSTPPPSPLGSVKSMVFIFLPKRVLTAKPHPPKKEKKTLGPRPAKVPEYAPGCRGWGFLCLLHVIIISVLIYGIYGITGNKK